MVTIGFLKHAGLHVDAKICVAVLLSAYSALIASLLLYLAEELIHFSLFNDFALQKVGINSENACRVRWILHYVPMIVGVSHDNFPGDTHTLVGKAVIKNSLLNLPNRNKAACVNLWNHF